MNKSLAERLEDTVDKLESISRRLVLLRECVVNNKDFLNEYDLVVYKGIINNLEEELRELSVGNSVIEELLFDCREILDNVKKELENFNSCYITSCNLEDVPDDISKRLDFQLRTLIAVRGVKQFYLNTKTLLGRKALEILNDINENIVVKSYSNETTKFKIELNEYNILEFEEITA